MPGRDYTDRGMKPEVPSCIMASFDRTFRVYFVHIVLTKSSFGLREPLLISGVNNIDHSMRFSIVLEGEHRYWCQSTLPDFILIWYSFGTHRGDQPVRCSYIHSVPGQNGGTQPVLPVLFSSLTQHRLEKLTCVPQSLSLWHNPRSGLVIAVCNQYSVQILSTEIVKSLKKLMLNTGLVNKPV